MLEREIEKQVCDYAKSHQLEVYKFSSPNRAGVPDRLFLAPYQHAFWIEFKSTEGTPTPLQIRECDRIRRFGFDVYLVNSVEEGKAVIDGELEVASMKIRAYLFGQQVMAEQDDDKTRH